MSQSLTSFVSYHQGTGLAFLKIASSGKGKVVCFSVANLGTIGVESREMPEVKMSFGDWTVWQKE